MLVTVEEPVGLCLQNLQGNTKAPHTTSSDRATYSKHKKGGKALKSIKADAIKFILMCSTRVLQALAVEPIDFLSTHSPYKRANFHQLTSGASAKGRGCSHVTLT